MSISVELKGFFRSCDSLDTLFIKLTRFFLPVHSGQANATFSMPTIPLISSLI
jgi:hypothetical protein